MGNEEVSNESDELAMVSHERRNISTVLPVT